MGILSNIFSKIFPSSHPAVTAPQAPAPGSMQSTPAGQAAPAAPASAPPSAPMEMVDVEAILSGMPQSQSLNWRTNSTTRATRATRPA